MALVALSLLAACGGGGGGISEFAFTSFSAIQPNTTQVMSGGVSTTVTGTYIGTLPNITLQSVNAPATSDGAGNTIRLTYDGAKTLSGMAFDTPSGGASFRRGAGFTCNSGVCGAETASGLGLVIDGTVPVPNAWSYQTFGVWAQVTSATTFQAGAVSAGAVTPASAVPLTGNPTFTGRANGFFAENGVGAYAMTASMTATADFDAGSIAFSTTGSMQIPLDPSVPQFSRPALDMTGRLTYTRGASSTFTGNVTTSGMAGTATGRFYGPAAQEMGGTFGLSGADGTLVGGFGGRQP